MTLLETLPINFEESQTLDDESLVKLIATTKNTLFFEILITRFEAGIYNRILGFIDTEEEAIELTRTFFVVLFSEIHLFKGPYDFSIWLYERAYRLCVNYLNTISELKKDSELINEPDDYLRIEVSDAILFRMKSKKLKKAISLIRPEDRAILILRYQDDVSFSDLALLLRLDNNSGKDSLTKAKASLVQAYNKI
jgi:RNA polymerase sigma-70 factor (ECF subfamily)